MSIRGSAQSSASLAYSEMSHFILQSVGMTLASPGPRGVAMLLRENMTSVPLAIEANTRFTYKLHPLHTVVPQALKLCNKKYCNVGTTQQWSLATRNQKVQQTQQSNTPVSSLHSNICLISFIFYNCNIKVDSRITKLSRS